MMLIGYTYGAIPVLIISDMFMKINSCGKLSNFKSSLYKEFNSVQRYQNRLLRSHFSHSTTSSEVTVLFSRLLPPLYQQLYYMIR